MPTPDSMKASELVAKLQELIKQHGDLPIILDGHEFSKEASDVRLEKIGIDYLMIRGFLVH